MSTTPDPQNQLHQMISEAVAVNVAGWTPKWLLVKRGFYYRPGACGYTDNIAEAGLFEREYAESDVSSTRGEVSMILAPPPPYATSADAVLPLMPRAMFGDFWTCDGGYLGHRVCIRNGDEIKAEGKADTFPLAACIALLRARGVEVVT